MTIFQSREDYDDQIHKAMTRPECSEDSTGLDSIKFATREGLKQLPTSSLDAVVGPIYITFDVDHEGVHLPKYLPNLQHHRPYMTVVLQRGFRDFKAHDGFFEVTLHFSGTPHHIQVPYNAIVAYIDKAASFMWATAKDLIKADDLKKENESEGADVIPFPSKPR